MGAVVAACCAPLAAFKPSGGAEVAQAAWPIVPANLEDIPLLDVIPPGSYTIAYSPSRGEFFKIALMPTESAEDAS